MLNQQARDARSSIIQVRSWRGICCHSPKPQVVPAVLRRRCAEPDQPRNASRDRPVQIFARVVARLNGSRGFRPGGYRLRWSGFIQTRDQSDNCLSMHDKWGQNDFQSNTQSG